VSEWPEEAKQSSREAVQLLVAGKNRKDVVSALAVEQDNKIQQDDRRIRRMIESSREFQEQFARLKKAWEMGACPLSGQHEQLMEIASSLS
jgi:ABC-type branched-subunit amino acid transport system ATPase component